MPTNLTMTSAAYNATGKFSQSLNAGNGVGGAIAAGGPFTAECWVKGTGAALQVFLHQQGCFWVGMTANGLPRVTYGSGENTDTSQGTKAINDGVWHHVAAVFNASGVQLYVDGTLQGSNTTTLASLNPTVSNPLSVRRYLAASGFDWTGEVDEVAIWSTAKYTAPFTPPTTAYSGSESGLVYLYHLDGNGADSQGATAPSTMIARNNAAIFYSPYNWNDDGTSANTNCSNAYLFFSFTGTSIALLTAALSGLATYPCVRAIIDEKTASEFVLGAGQTSTLLASGLSSGTHTLRLEVKYLAQSGGNMWTLANAVKITGFAIDNGASVAAISPKTPRAIMFGDSITMGTGAIGSGGDDTKCDGTVVALALVARSLGCEFGQIGYGGQGFINGNGLGVPALSESYALKSSGVSRLSGGLFTPAPDHVFCWEGTNPATGTSNLPTQADIVSVINSLRAAAPNAYIFMVVPPTGYRRAEITGAVATVSDAKVFLIDAGSTSEWQLPASPSIYGSDQYHPYAGQHARLAATYARQVQRAVEPRRFKIVAS